MSEHASPPRENLIRAVTPGVQVRDGVDGEPDGSTLFGYFSRSNEWTEIASDWEGNFMERFAPGAHKKTLRDGRDKLRVLFQHGQDPEIGDKPIAQILDVYENDQGAYYEARLFDNVPPLVRDGLAAGQYGASFRFSVVREEIEERPPMSDFNPKGLPERTVKEARVAEFGPVTFPAYEGATADVRSLSLTDDFILRCFERDPDRLREMFEHATELRADEPDEQDPAEEEREQDAPSTADAVLVGTLAPERRASRYNLDHKEEAPQWRLP